MKTKVLFVCTGNICRSPMAEYLLKDMLQKYGKANDVIVSSAAVSDEEHGNPVHYGTRTRLAREGISCEGHHARQITLEDYENYDLIIGMDNNNIRGIKRITNGDPKNKVHKMMEYCGLSRDVEDPWFTGDFDTTYNDIFSACTELIKFF